MRSYILICMLSRLCELVRPFSEDEIIIQNPGRLTREINSVQSSWVAEDYFKRPVTVGDVENFLGARLRSFPVTGNGPGTDFKNGRFSDLSGVRNIQKIMIPRLQHLLPKVPRNLDLRSYYPFCKVLTTIRDQSKCGSCWAVSSTSALSDRFCIATSGKVNVQLSAENILTCCKSCGKGCDGGYVDKTFDHFKHVGAITGGDYASEYGCQPYSVAPLSDPSTTHSEDGSTPPCKTSCTNPKYKIPIETERRYKVKNYYEFPDKNVTKIQWDLMLNGPSVAAFVIYSDFMLYRSGVYRHTKGINCGGHAVKLIGWGRENGMDYWLLANSWNTTWGLKGTFKIRRGVNECYIESFVSAGEPDVAASDI